MEKGRKKERKLDMDIRKGRKNDTKNGRGNDHDIKSKIERNKARRGSVSRKGTLRGGRLFRRDLERTYERERIAGGGSEVIRGRQQLVKGGLSINTWKALLNSSRRCGREGGSMGGRRREGSLGESVSGKSRWRRGHWSLHEEKRGRSRWGTHGKSSQS